MFGLIEGKRYLGVSLFCLTQGYKYSAPRTSSFYILALLTFFFISEYLDYFPHFYCYIHYISVDIPFSFLQVFLVELRSVHVEFRILHRTSN